MKIELVTLDSLLLGGMSYYGDPISTKGGWNEENEIGNTFQRFIQFIMENPDRPYSSHGSTMYEVHVYNRDTPVNGHFEVFVGEEVKTPELPIALACKYIPSSRYLRVTLSGGEITGDWWQTLDTEIMPARQLTRLADYIIQAYDERFKGLNNLEESEMDAFIPVAAL